MAALAPTPTQRPERTPHVHVVSERCAGCQECVIRCPTEALAIASDGWTVEAHDYLCVGCRQCERTCPFGAIHIEGPLLVGPRQGPLSMSPPTLLGDMSELHRGFPSFQQALVEAERCLLCPDPTCMQGCPAHNDIPGFISALRDDNLKAAQAILSETSVLPDICSRVCDTAVQCEGACSWALAGGEPVAIGLLERYVADERPLAAVEHTGDRGENLSVAVVGSGPAGIGAAWELLSEGAGVTMLEQEAEPGGVLRWGIPAFTLPDTVTRRPIDALLAAGLELKTGCALGRDLTLEQLLVGHDAVVLAHGANRPLIPPIAGADLPHIEDATSFLARSKEIMRYSEPTPAFRPGRRVLVLGGGNTAIDVARTVRRLGGAATCVEWMDRRFARVRPDELEHARHEGVSVRFSTTVERLEGDTAGVHTAWLRKTRQRRVNRLPKVRRGAAEPLAVDHVVFALGYRVERPVGSEAIQIPLAAAERRDALLDRRWLASGIMTRSRTQIGWLALERETGLAVASSPVATGWWTRLRARSRTQPQSAREGWWALRWRRRAASGLAAAPEQQADRVWVAGDALVGPATVAGAMAQGTAAARAILETLGTQATTTLSRTRPER